MLITSTQIRQKSTLYAERLHQHKGTTKALEILFTWLGFYDIVFEEIFDSTFGFDVGNFDANNRNFDGKCSRCARLNIYLTHNNLNDDLIAVVNSIVAWGVPLNVVTYTYYNGDFASIFDNTFDETFQ
ncbi:MAG: hypothetical protein OHK0045_21970 [Raineya sp.]